MVAYSVIQELLDELDSEDRTAPLNKTILTSITHYIFCASDMPTVLIDLTTSLINQIQLYNQTICVELLSQVIQALYHCSFLLPQEVAVGGEQGRSLYQEIDYIFDKIVGLFGMVDNSIDFLMKDWQYQRYFCTILAETQYYYFKSK